MDNVELPKIPIVPIAFPIPPPFVKSTIGVQEIYITPIETGFGFGVTFPKEVPEELKVFQQYAGKSKVIVYSKKALDALVSASGVNAKPDAELYRTVVGKILEKIKELGGTDYQAKYFDEAVLVTVQGSGIVCKNERIVAGERLVFTEPIFPEPLKSMLMFPVDVFSKMVPLR